MEPLPIPSVVRLHAAMWDAWPKDCAVGFCELIYGYLHPLYRSETWIP